MLLVASSDLAEHVGVDPAPHPNANDAERPGSFREHDIQPFPGGMKPPPWAEVPAMTGDWISDVQKLRDDGTGRLVLNLLLVRLGYPPPQSFTRATARAT